MIGSSSTGDCCAHAVLEAHRARHLERVLVRIDFVERAVVQGDFDVDHRIAGQHASLKRFLDALVHSRNVFARHGAALDRIDKLETLARLLRF